MEAVYNRKNEMTKGIVCALCAMLLAFLVTEIAGMTGSRGEILVANVMGYKKLATYIQKERETSDYETKLNDTYEAYCKEKKLNPKEDKNMVVWMNNEMDTAAKLVADYKKSEAAKLDAQDVALREEFESNGQALMDAYDRVARVAAYLWSFIVTVLLGLGLLLTETKKIKKILLGVVISAIMGLVSGWLAQLMYTSLMPENKDDVFTLVVRGLGWSVMGLGAGLAIGLLRKEKKAILLCILTGFVCAFVSGAVFEIAVQIFTSNALIARGIALLFLGALTGAGFRLNRMKVLE